VAGAAGLAGAGLWSGRAAAVAGDDWKGAFDAALKTDRRLIGWQGLTVDALETPLLEVRGAWPAGLEGTFYRNGPTKQERAGRRYHHWFDGDGMVQAFRMEGGRIEHRGRLVATAKLAEEDKAGQFMLPAFGTLGAPGRGLMSPDELNVANISTLFHAGELLALWEAGSAHVLDPLTLETRGRKAWRDDLKGLPFSAHPKVEPDGTLWSFGYDTSGRIVLYHIGADGAVRNIGVLEAAPLGMVHDFVVTERHLVFALAPFVIEESMSAEQTFLDAHRWRPELGMRIVAVAKETLNGAATWQLPAGFSFHFGNAWEEGDGTIRFDYCLAPDATIVTETLRYVMRGEWRAATAPTRFAQVTLRPGRSDGIQEIAEAPSEFPRVSPAVVGRRYRYVYALGATTLEWYTAVARWDLESGTRASYDYGGDFIAEEHVFVPRPGATDEGDGWVLGTALDVTRGITTLNVFDAARLADGPLARAVAPYALPLGFHGQFVQA
jgi:carotenoid cleavage dioxygenase